MNEIYTAERNHNSVRKKWLIIYGSELIGWIEKEKLDTRIHGKSKWKAFCEYDREWMGASDNKMTATLAVINKHRESV